MTHLLGIDVGTSGTKAIVVGDDGSILDRPPKPRTPHPAVALEQQPPEDWWTSTIAAVREACGAAGIEPDAIDAVGLTGQMHGLVALDGDATHPSGDSVVRRAVRASAGRSSPGSVANDWS